MLQNHRFQRWKGMLHNKVRESDVETFQYHVLEDFSIVFQMLTNSSYRLCNSSFLYFYIYFFYTNKSIGMSTEFISYDDSIRMV
jgi:hypothetical protein